MNLKIAPEYQEVYNTHDFDFSKPIKTTAMNYLYTDYKCKNCDISLTQSAQSDDYYIGSCWFDGHENRTCNEILMKNIME